MTDEVRSADPLIAVLSLVNDDETDNDVLGKLLSKDFAVVADPDDSSQRLLSIACKYYTADVIVRRTCDREEAMSAEAVVIYFDGQESTSWRQAIDWMKLSKTWGIPLRLLVCYRLSSSPDFYRTVMLAMLDVQFELVELDPSQDTVDPDDEYGATRIKSAIEAHLWPNRKMLENPRARRQVEPTPTTQSEEANEDKKAATANSPGQQTTSNAEGTSTPTEERDPAEEIETEFERAFASLMDIRNQVVGCTDKEMRHRLAEELTVKFWRAIGGSADETEGLLGTVASSSSEDEGDGEVRAVPSSSCSKVASS